MAVAQNPTISRRRLRAELRDARGRAGFTQRDVIDAMDWSLSKLIRIETGMVTISTSDLRALLQHYGIVDRDEVDRFVEMARAAKEPEWWATYKDSISQQLWTYLGYESSASVISQFQLSMIPGLLQEEDYARAVFQAFSRTANIRRVDDLVDLRMRRQEELANRRGHVETVFLLDEAVLHRQVAGPEVMRRQLTRLKEEAGRDNVTIEIVPFTTGEHAGLNGPFIILQFPEPNDGDILYLENSRGEMLGREEGGEVEPFREAMLDLRDRTKREDFEKLIDNALRELG